MDNVNNFFIRIKAVRDKFIEVLRQMSSPQWNLQPLIDLINRNYDQLMQLRQLDEKQCLNAVYDKCTRPLLAGKCLENRSIVGIIDLLRGFDPPDPDPELNEAQNWLEYGGPIVNDFIPDVIEIDANGVVPNHRLEVQDQVINLDEIDPPVASPINTQVEDSIYTSEELLLIGVVLTQLATPEILAPIWDQLTLITNCSKLIHRKMRLTSDQDDCSCNHNYNLE